MSENKDAVRLFNTEIIEKGNFSSFDALVSKDFVNHTAPAGSSKERDAFLAFFVNVLHPAFSDLSVEIHDQVEEASKVATRKTIRGTHTGVFMGHAASGRTIDIRVTDIVRVENGKYAEHWSNADLFGAIAQITSPAA